MKFCLFSREPSYFMVYETISSPTYTLNNQGSFHWGELLRQKTNEILPWKGTISTWKCPPNHHLFRGYLIFLGCTLNYIELHDFPPPSPLQHTSPQKNQSTLMKSRSDKKTFWRLSWLDPSSIIKPLDPRRYFQYFILNESQWNQAKINSHSKNVTHWVLCPQG